jgi:hypothetical protein
MYLTHLEQEIDVDFLIEEYSKDQITSVFPFITLSKRQIFQNDLKGKRTGMNKSEKKFANYLINDEFIVYHEPRIVECARVPDFLICKRGLFNEIIQASIVEITDMSFYQQTSDQRKSKQLKEIEQACGQFDFSFRALFKEDLNLLYNLTPTSFFNS